MMTTRSNGQQQLQIEVESVTAPLLIDIEDRGYQEAMYIAFGEDMRDPLELVVRFPD